MARENMYEDQYMIYSLNTSILLYFSVQKLFEHKRMEVIER